KIDSQDISDYLEGEKNFLGIDHCAVGKALAERWQLPKVLVSPIAHHHHPEDSEEKDRALVYAVHLGDILAMMGGSGTGADSLGYSINPDYTNYLNISAEGIGLVMLNVMTEFKKTMKMVSGEEGQS
ncbi:MAG: HDOD domain-containing protein, partial [Planctomycetes bacterium]|nr:HDOD domain-containing protein [Planctomycetota bacterium]